MEHNTLIMATIIARGIASAVAFGGATFLAYHGKEGWGWLIFAAILASSYSVVDS